MPTLSFLRRQNVLWWFIASAWFGAWHLFATWHIWKDPVRFVPGPVGDNTVMLWNLGWVKHALSHGSPGFWFKNAYYPDGFLFLYGTHTWLDGVLYTLTSPLLKSGIDGLVLWANLNMLFSTCASGILLVSALRAWGVRSWIVLLLASSGAVFSWFRMFAMTGHYHFFGTHWMLLALCLASWGRERAVSGNGNASNRLFMGAGLALGVSFLNDQTMMVFAAILGGFVILGLPANNRSWGHRLKQIAGAGARYYGFALVPASVHLIPVAVSTAAGWLHYRVDVDVQRLVDATSLLLPPDYHLLGPSLHDLRQQHGLHWSEGTYLGIAPAFLLLVGTIASGRLLLSRRGEKPAVLWVCFYATLAAWGFIVCALGDNLAIGREQIMTFPGRILKELPILNNIRLPQRWVWPAHLCIALAGATGINHYITTAGHRWLAWACGAIALIPPLEGKSYSPPQPLDFREFPVLKPMPVVNAVKNHYNGGSVLLMPLSEAYSRGNILQLLWGFDIPLTYSYTARLPYLLHETPVGDDVWSVADGKWLSDKQVRIVVFPLDTEDPERLSEWVQQAKESVPNLVVLDRSGNVIQSAH